MPIELSTGDGHVDVVYDGRPRDTRRWIGGGQDITTATSGGQLVAYDGTARFHARFDGRTHYESRSGLSHAGSIPGYAGVVKVATYRVDVARLRLPHPDRVPEVYGRRLIVPVSYATGAVAQDWPVLDVTNAAYAVHPVEQDQPRHWAWLERTVQTDFGPDDFGSVRHGERTIRKLRLLAVEDVNRWLLGQRETEPHEVGWTVYQPSPFAADSPEAAGDPRLADPLDVQVEAHVPATSWAVSSYARRCAVRDVVAHALDPILRFEGDDAGTPAHWVGMRRHGAHVYVIRRGRAVRWQSVAALTPGAHLPELDLTVTPDDAADTLSTLLPDGFVALTTDVVVGRGSVLTADGEAPVAPADELRLIQTRDAAAARELVGAPIRANRRDPAGNQLPEPRIVAADEPPLQDWERELLQS